MPPTRRRSGGNKPSAQRERRREEQNAQFQVTFNGWSIAWLSGKASHLEGELLNNTNTTPSQIHHALGCATPNPILESIVHEELKSPDLRTSAFEYLGLRPGRDFPIWMVEEPEEAYTEYDSGHISYDDLVYSDENFCYFTDDPDDLDPECYSLGTSESFISHPIEDAIKHSFIDQVEGALGHPPHQHADTFTILPIMLRQSILQFLDCHDRMKLALNFPSMLEAFTPCHDGDRTVSCCKCPGAPTVHGCSVLLSGSTNRPINFGHPLTLGLMEYGLYHRARNRREGVSTTIFRAFHKVRLGYREKKGCWLPQFYNEK